MSDNQKGMKKETADRIAVYAKYITPLLAALMIIAACLLPGVYYFYDGKPHEKQSVYSLAGATWETVSIRFGGGAESDADESAKESTRSFIRGAAASVVAFHVLTVLSLLLSGYLTGMSLAALRLPCRSPAANRIKTWLHLIIPNRVCHFILLFLPLLPTLFPYFLARQYEKSFGIGVTVLYRGIPPVVFVACFVLLSVILFFAAIPAERRLKMNMFRRYPPRGSAADGGNADGDADGE